MISVARVASFVAAAMVGLIGAGAPALAADLDWPATPMAQIVETPTPVQTPVIPVPLIVMPQAISAPATPTMTVERDEAEQEAEEEFATLDAAVAAQDRAAADEATRCLAGAVYFESRGEPLSGQLAVAEVIINRAKSGRFPADVCGVVTQRGQFGFVRGGRIPSIDEERAAYRTAVAVAQVALADAWNSDAANALYFNTPGRAPGARLRRVAMIGNHVFYR